MASKFKSISPAPYKDSEDSSTQAASKFDKGSNKPTDNLPHPTHGGQAPIPGRTHAK